MRLLPFLLTLLLLQGCIPLPQLEKGKARHDFGMVTDDRRSVMFDQGDTGKRKPYTILAERSYAIDPSGKRHPIKIEPHGYDLDEHFPFIRDDISVLRSEARPHVIRLRDGEWKFVLAMQRGKQVSEETYPFRLWTFYYNPIIHGPPN